MNDFLSQLIARLVEQFKFKNPKTYALIILILGALIYFAQQGTLLGVFEIKPVLAGVIQFVATVFGFLSGAQTFKYLSKAQQESR